MKEAIDEQIEANAQGAAAQEDTGAKTEISLGKFKDVNALLSAYNSLESEFTKRCQRIKELEGIAASDKTKVPDNREGQAEGTSEENKVADKNEILKDYLKGIINSRQTAIVIDDAGVGVKAPAEKPKTIAQAGMLAKEYFK